MNDPFASSYSILKRWPALVGYPWNSFICCGLYCPRSNPCNTEIKCKRNSIIWPLQFAHNSKKQLSYAVFCQKTIKASFFRKKERGDSPWTAVLLLPINLEDTRLSEPHCSPCQKCCCCWDPQHCQRCCAKAAFLPSEPAKGRAAPGCCRTSLPQSSAVTLQLSTNFEKLWLIMGYGHQFIATQKSAVFLFFLNHFLFSSISCSATDSNIQ